MSVLSCVVCHGLYHPTRSADVRCEVDVILSVETSACRHRRAERVSATTSSLPGTYTAVDCVSRIRRR